MLFLKIAHFSLNLGLGPSFVEIVNNALVRQFVESAHNENHNETQKEDVCGTSSRRSDRIDGVQVVRVRHMISQVPLDCLVDVPVIQEQLPFQLFQFSLRHKQICLKITQRLIFKLLINVVCQSIILPLTFLLSYVQVDIVYTHHGLHSLIFILLIILLAIRARFKLSSLIFKVELEQSDTLL